MLCPEWWGYEIVTILGGYIGVNEQAVLVVLFNIIAFMFMVPLGLQSSISKKPLALWLETN